MLRFHTKKKRIINFDSYLDKQRMHFDANQLYREHDKVIDGTLAGKLNSADVFRFVPNYKKSKIYH